MKTVILGMGNTILADDGVGIYIVREFGRQYSYEDVDVKESSLAGINVVELLAGYDKAIVVDAIRTDEAQPGKVYTLTPDDFEVSKHYASAHHINFSSALELGKQLGEDIPDQIIIFAVEVKDIETFSEQCTTQEVREAIPKVVQMIKNEVT
jgi:hydrogenase maturation protease